MKKSKVCWFCLGAITGSVLFCVLEQVEFVSDRGVRPTLKAQFSKIETTVASAIFVEDGSISKGKFQKIYSMINFKPRRASINGRDELVTFLLNPALNVWVERGLPCEQKRPLVGAIIHGETNTLAVYTSDRHIVSIPCRAQLKFDVASNGVWNSYIDFSIDAACSKAMDLDIGF